MRFAGYKTDVWLHACEQPSSQCVQLPHRKFNRTRNLFVPSLNKLMNE